MAKSDLLKEAIADAKAVKETALANAKLALEEAFAPRIQSMLSHKLAEELEDEESMEEELDSTELGAGDNAEPSADAADSSDIENDSDLTEEEDEMYSEEDEMEAEEELDMAADEEGEEYELTGDEEEDTEEDDLDLEAVIRELEDAMASDEEEMTEEEGEEEMTSEEDEMEAEPVSEEDEEELDINEIIRTLKEMEGEDEEVNEEEEESNEGWNEEKEEELQEAYKTIQSMRNTINEVNLLNAKLLYTNKLFRTFDLNESQKVKVIENFDRASNLREVKLVFATLGENLNVARKKKTVVKESLASKPMKSTAAPKKILSEGEAVAERFKKLAGLIK